MRDTQIVFGDLKDAVNALNTNITSPVDVRRSFSLVITKSQQLTESMRKEYSQIKGQKWEASYFEGWNDVTALFKKLRRADYHEYPVEISVQESQHYLVGTATFPNGKVINLYQIAIVEWGIGDPFSSRIPSKMTVIRYDENMVQLEHEDPEIVEFEFLLRPRTKEIEKALELAGTNDIHKLSNMCLAIMEEYLNFYNEQLKINNRSGVDN